MTYFPILANKAKTVQIANLGLDLQGLGLQD